MKKIVALLVALMLVCSAAAMAATDIAILVPNADHGWTGAVLTYAEEKAAAINAEGKYEAKVISSADPANQISQVEDIIENESAKSIVILPQDNTLEATMKKLANSGIPFVMFDRVSADTTDFFPFHSSCSFIGTFYAFYRSCLWLYSNRNFLCCFLIL